MFVGIAVRGPIGRQRETSSESEKAVQSRPSIEEQNEIRRYDDEHPSDTNEKEKETDDAAMKLASTTLPNGIDSRTLEKQPELKITKANHDVESITLAIGDILVLDDGEELRVISGGLALLSIGYTLKPIGVIQV